MKEQQKGLEFRLESVYSEKKESGHKLNGCRQDSDG
jgi:hypothetical protein